MPEISVVIPVYKVEDSIERCAVSLLEQTLDGIEFIFVDDGSPDRSVPVLQSVVRRYPDRNVRILHMPCNSGLPEARLAGLLASSGDYVIGVDSDDWLSPEMLEKMYSCAIATGADVVMCGWMADSPGGRSEARMPAHPSGREEFISGLLNGSIPGFVWNKLIRRTVLEPTPVTPAFNMAEDVVWSVQVVNRSSAFSFLDEPLYHYCLNPDSLTMAAGERQSVERLRQNKGNLDLIFSYLSSEGLSGRYATDILTAKYNVRRWIRHLIGRKEYYRMWKSTYPEVDRLFLRSAGVPARLKVSYLLALTKLELLWRPVYRCLKLPKKC